VADDFAMPLLVAARGHRLVYAHDAVAEERLPAQGIENFRAKARIVTRGASALRIYWREVLRAGPVRVLQYLLHKVARWLMGFVLAALLAVSAIGASHPILAAALTAQVAFYLLGIAAYLLARRGPVPGLLRMPFYFLLVNAAALAGLADFARGRRRATWEKSETTRRAPDEEVAVAEHAAHEVPAGRHFSRRTALLVAAVLATAALLAAETGARLTYAARDALRAMNLVAVRNAPRQVYVLPLPTDDRRLLPDSEFRVAELARPRPDTRRPSLAERARSAGIGEDEVALRINAQGYKGPPLDPEHRLPRLLALGDSCTFGSLLDRLSYPRALERELAALGMPVEVVNAGVPSAEPRHLVARLDEFRALRPDAAVLCMGWDALYAQRYTPTTWLDQLYILRGVRALWGRWREHSPDTGEVPPRLPDRPLRPDPHDPEIQRLGRYEPPFLDDVKRLAEGLRAAEIPVFVLTVPTLYVSGERPTEQALELGVLPRFTDNPYVLAALASRYNQRLRELADGSGLELIDVAAWGREALKPRHRYFASPSALNEEGQQRMGALVAQRVHASLGATRR
jgi:hypothetical protein